MLDQLVNTQKENNKRLANIEKQINALVKVNTQQANQEKTQNKRAQNMARREKSRLETPAQAVGRKAKEKKEGGNLLGNILKNPLVLGAGVAFLSYGIYKVLSDEKIQKKMRELIGKAFTFATEVIGPKIKEYFDKAWNFLAPKITSFYRDKLEPLLIKTMEKGGEILEAALVKAFNSIKNGLFNFMNPGRNAGNNTKYDNAVKGMSGEDLQKAEKYNKALEKKNKLELEYYKIAAAIVGFEKLKSEGHNVDGEIKLEKAQLANKQKELDLQVKEMQNYKRFAQDKKFYEEEDFRRRKAQEMKFRPGEHAFSTNPILPGIAPGMRMFPLNQDELGRFQAGGPVTVPGSGDGDKVPALLPAGSFVMNKVATGALGFQEGGVIPALVEPGETIYGPGQFGPLEVMANSLIPRFQSGGFAGSSNVVDTGYKDGKGRPAMLSPGAAKGLKGMIDKGMKWNPGDVANVYRDKSEYQRLLNAGYSPALRSKHNFGEAMDVHGSMGQWIRRNGKDFGWAANDYAGSHGGHYEFHGGAPSPGRDETYGDKQQSNAGGEKNVPANQLGGGGDPTKGLGGSGVLSSISETLGNVVGGFGNLAHKTLYKMGLPGLADVGYIFSEGFKQSKLSSMLGDAAGSVFNMLGGLGQMLGGLFGIQGASAKTNVQAPKTPQSNIFGGMESFRDSANDQKAAEKGAKDQAAAPAGSGNFSNSFKGFYDMAKKAGAKFPQLVAAQWQLESASGTALSGKHNYFGIKATGNESGSTKSTWEVINGQDVTVNARFKDFAHPQDAVNHLVGQWHKNYKGYSGVNNAQDAYAAADMLRAEGYATDPIYAQKLKRIMKENGHQRGGVINMKGAQPGHMKRYQQATEQFMSSMASGSTPIIVPVPVPSGGGGGGGQVNMTGGMGAPAAPMLPDGPQVVALLELQNRLALGAAI